MAFFNCGVKHPRITAVSCSGRQNEGQTANGTKIRKTAKQAKKRCWEGAKKVPWGNNKEILIEGGWIEGWGMGH
ncbi:MAG: hypothetical protein COB37_11525 [Kordiimonadales bacterium]|nr:MAG: hypothetical protein COB37_11525 [Kordiimonadales bacterium]